MQLTRQTEDPYINLGATLLVRAVRDARRGDLSGYLYLASAEAAEIMDELGWPEDAARQLVEREEKKMLAAADKRKPKRNGFGYGRPYLILVPVPGTRKLRVAGELSWTRPGPEIAAERLPTIARQYEIVVIDDPARPHRSLLDHATTWLAAWINSQQEIQGSKGGTQ